MKELKELILLRIFLVAWGCFIAALHVWSGDTWTHISCELLLIATGVFCVSVAIREHRRKCVGIVYHRNTWWWGKSITVIANHGSGMCELCILNDDKDWGLINGLSVIESERRCGLGTALVKECERLGIEMGIKQFFLAVRKESWLVEWYKSLGYEMTDEEINGEYKMRKQLTQDNHGRN